MTEYFGIRQTVFTVFLILGFLSLVGSFIVSYVLARKTLNPLIQIARTVEKMDLEKLDTTLFVNGHPQDELVLLVKRFNEMISQLKNMTERQKEFVANASHELKTPLTRAITSLEVLENTPKATTEIQLIKKDLFYINDLLNKLLLLTKLKKDEDRFTKKHISIKILLQNIQTQLKDQLEKKQLTLVINVTDLIITVLPREYLEIILSNLITNAIKYSPPKKTILVSANQSDSYTVIMIKDQGIGMDKEEVDHMFERFYRGKALSNQEKGFGIGLSIVKQICDIYNIKIQVVSQKEKGTAISFKI